MDYEKGYDGRNMKV